MTPSPRRILQLASTSDMGGAERMILLLSEGLDGSRFAPHVGALVGGGELIRRAAAAGIPSCHFQFRWRFDPAGIARLVRYIRREQIELVQTHGLRADSVARWAARLGGARVVISTIHSVDPWRRWPHVMLDRVTARWADRFVAVCEAARQASIAREKTDPARIDVVYIGLPDFAAPATSRAEVRSALGLSSDAFPVIGILANLREMKGHRDVVEALPEILKALPNTVFLFAGHDNSEGAIERLARERGVAHAIRFLGFRSDTPELLSAMDLFMLPSTWEGLPVSILEALHAGVPVIATSVGGIPEIIPGPDDGGVLIEPRRPDQIAATVISLAGDRELRERMAAGALARARSRFSIHSMVERMQEIYDEALAGGAGIPR